MKYVLDNKRLKSLMIQFDVDQTTVADIVGVTQPAIFSLLQAPRDTSLPIVEALAAAFGVPIHELLIEVSGDPMRLPVSAAVDRGLIDAKPRKPTALRRK